MRHAKYALAVPKNLGVGVDFRPCSESDFLTGRPQYVLTPNTGRVKNIFAMWLQSIFGENAQTEAWNWKLAK